MNPLLTPHDEGYVRQLQDRLAHFQRLERLQNRRAEIAIRLLRGIQKNPNILTGRRRVREYLRTHWEVLNHEDR
jgi:hypothetical protein